MNGKLFVGWFNVLIFAIGAAGSTYLYATGKNGAAETMMCATMIALISFND